MSVEKLREDVARVLCIRLHGKAFDYADRWQRDNACDFADAAIAALGIAASDLAGLRAGTSVVVPVEATADIRNAMRASFNADNSHTTSALFNAVYKAALAARPGANAEGGA